MDDDDNSGFLTDTPTPTPPSPTKNPINPKIMLTSIIVLFLAVVAVMCFHSYSRWLSERRRRLLQLSSDPATPATPRPIVGLDKSVLKSLPGFTFGSKHVHCECAVCLSEFVEGDIGRQLPNCGHSFHTACIDEWFGSNASCPLCRAPVDQYGQEAVVLTVVEDDVQAMTAGGLSMSSCTPCPCSAGNVEEGDRPAESHRAKMADRSKCK